MRLTQLEVLAIRDALSEEKCRLLDLDTVPADRKPVRADSPHLLRIIKLKESFECFKTSPGNIYSLSYKESI